jgi:hypothetical protein
MSIHAEKGRAVCDIRCWSPLCNATQSWQGKQLRHGQHDVCCLKCVALFPGTLLETLFMHSRVIWTQSEWHHQPWVVLYVLLQLLSSCRRVPLHCHSQRAFTREERHSTNAHTYQPVEADSLGFSHLCGISRHSKILQPLDCISCSQPC